MTLKQLPNLSQKQGAAKMSCKIEQYNEGIYLVFNSEEDADEASRIVPYIRFACVNGYLNALQIV